MGQDRVTLTGDHFDIQDQDTEPTDIQITLVAEPSNGTEFFPFTKFICLYYLMYIPFSNGPVNLTGRLQRFDPLTNSDRTVQEGEVFDYQELLDGNIAFISSAEEAQIRFQVKHELEIENVKEKN